MRKIKFYVTLFVTILFVGCVKQDASNTDAVGGQLPTNYVQILDNGFSPSYLKVVAGSSITFLNTTASAKTIMTVDTVTIRKTTIEPNKSYYFHKDTTGTFIYVNTANSASGSFTLMP